MKERNYEKGIFYLLLGIAVILCGVIMKVASSVVLPVIISIILSCAFLPLVNGIHQKLKCPWILCVILVSLLFVVFLVLFSTIIFSSINTMISQYGNYESKFLSMYKEVAIRLGLPFDERRSFIENIWQQEGVRNWVRDFTLTFSNDVINISKVVGVVFLFVVFLLLEINFTKEKVGHMFKKTLSNRVLIITNKIVNDVVRFLSIKFFISFATGFLVFVSCYVMHVDFAIMWGFFAFVLNFIPTFGSIASVVITTLFTALQFWPDPFPIIFVFCAMGAINMILGNIVEPRIEGKSLDVSPYVILVSLTFWGWMWGFVGMILAVPVMVVLKIICENVSFLHPIAIILGNRAEDTVKALHNYDIDDEDDEFLDESRATVKIVENEDSNDKF